MIKNPGKRFLSDLKLYSDYLRWRDDVGRYETWEEAIDEILNQHITKYDGIDISDEVNFVRQFIYDRKVLASQRNLQFRGDEVFKHCSRLFNCSVSYIDRPEVFKQSMYLLLSGCGFGFSVEKRYVSKLPTIKRRKDSTITYEIPDSIEGWALALDELMNSYFTGGDKIRFDYSAIRPKNSLIAGRFLAPGHEPLKRSMEIIEGLLDGLLGDHIEISLEPINCYDIICNASDAVLSAGLRRSALICLFDKDDNDMINSKTGDWYIRNPQRARSNNSVKLIKGQYTFEEYNSFASKIKEFGEPGFILVDDERFVTNPCQPKSATLLTPHGITTMGDINVGDLIWSSEGWTEVVKKWSTGIKDVYSYKTNAGEFLGTENHRLISNGEKIEANQCESIDLLTGNITSTVIDPQTVMDGLVLGDGGIHKASSNLRLLHIGKNDSDYFTSEVADLIIRKRDGISPTAWEIKTNILADELIALNERSIPDRYFYGTADKVASFLRGLYSANGSVVNNRITFKTSSSRLRDQIQLLLSSLGIRSYYTTNKPKNVEFKNGTYLCKESYDINISSDRDKFANLIGFIHKYKNDKINLSNIGRGNSNYPITSVDYVSTEEVFDITVNNDTHTYWTGGVNVSNCGEIGFIPINPSNGKSCIAFCNLTEINATGINSKSELLSRVKAATILGTLQSGYNNFPFLGKDTEELCRWENLLGVSITGWFDNPKLFNEEWLTEAAEYAKQVNKEFALKLGINPSARITCTKPSGNASVILGTSSGIHPAHSRNYFRVMQINKDSDVAKWVLENKPEMIENSVWSANKTDYVIYVPITESNDAIVKTDISSIEFLEKVKLVQSSWVLPGRDTSLGYSKFVSHNVSNTVQVDNWDETFKYLYDNKEYFCGVSFLPNVGDKIYKQAPFTSVLMSDELFDKYGSGCLFASGLIVDMLNAFDNDLWDACDAVINKDYFLSGNNLQVLQKKDIIRRAKKFAKNYFKFELNDMISCLKDIHLYHKWRTITSNMKPIDLGSILTKPKHLSADELGAVACSGGACEIL